MMAKMVYILGALGTLLCAVLLLRHYVYMVRLAGYLVILFAIFRKNRKSRTP